jgi:phytoene desaturase
MNYADMCGGTWYPMGGMGRIAEAMEKLALSLGVDIRYNTPVRKITCVEKQATGVETAEGFLACDALIAACDYHHTETALLPPEARSYSSAYWAGRSMAPSCLLYYLGINTTVTALQHHNLFFDAPFDTHADALYTKPEWPADPLMYVCCPSKTDPHVAPAGGENLFVLIPVAPGLPEGPDTRQHYLDIAIRRIEKRTGMNIRPHITFQRSYAGRDFSEDYNAFRGNAYGLANTLRQTANLKPSIRSRRLRNLFFAGQLTVPGPGVPPALISGEVAAGQVNHYFTGKTIPQTV